MLDTVVISGDDVCCSVVFDTLVGVFVFIVMWSELLMTYIISYPLWSSVYDSVYETCNMMRFLSLLLLALCPYGDAMVPVTVMRVLLLVMYVCGESVRVRG